ncbi:hypothetical protein SAMN04488134_11319 [Amphibacillus marinus]|uniref:Uncharacterized protein n=2 Tax=Amphibacillus marinus TaxID=872970 RepID=A0A1H8SLH5_9BACI|nr:hypothetical protein SAMN04488134_11319 [Amphibacillus marinus]
MKNSEGNFDDMPVGEIISYEHFLYLLDTGREIEFYFNNKEYFIGHHKEGRVLWQKQIQLSDYYNGDNRILLDTFKIESVTLRELINKEHLKISTVF